nr:hypothetical protein [Nannocystis sp.]
MTTTTTMSISSLLLLSGCIQDLLDQGAALAPDTETAASTTSTGEPPTPTTSDEANSSPVATVTGPPDETTSPSTTQDPGTTMGVEENLPPAIELFAVSPKHLSEAGPAELQLVVSADVVKVRLSLDGMKLTDDLKPMDFPHAWDALSAKDNGDTRIFEVVVEDAEGLTAMATTELSVQLPQPGAEKCLFEDKEANSSVISALKYTDDAIIAEGSRDTGAGLRLTVWKLDPDTCQPLPAWPKTLANWSAQPGLAAMTSLGTAVDVDEDGNIVVAGNFLVAGKLQSYVVLLNPGGSLLWEKLGQVGDEVTGVAAATAQFKNRVFVVGSQQTSDVPVRTDAAIWTYLAIDGAVSIGSSLTLKAPFTPDEFDPDVNNKYSERVRAVVLQPDTGNALAVGEREFSPDGNKTYIRAFTVQAHPLGGVVGTPWTSWAPSFVHDAVRSVALCGDDVLAGGWTRDQPADAKPQPMMFWIEDDGASMKHRHEPQLGSTEINGMACDREAKIISAATRDTGARDARVFTVPGQDGPHTLYETGAAGDDGAGAVACDWRGFCGWGGYRTINAKMVAVVRVHHP